MTTTGQATATNGRGRIHPAPPPLATLTDLTPDRVRAVAKAVNPIIADAFALYLKTRNFHWHLAGAQGLEPAS